MYSILFNIGPVPIRAYGLMLWLALVASLIIGIRASKRTNIKPDQVIDACLYAIVAGIVFAHVASILLDLPFYWKNPGEIVGLWTGILSPGGGIRGLSFHGGLIGGIGMVALYTRRQGIKFLAMADLLAPSLSIAYGITRIGCFLNGCCYGVPTNLPWGVRFPADGGGLTPPSHPVQLYAVGISVLIYFMLIAVRNRQRFVGQVFASYLVFYSVYRFLIEFLRKGVTGDVIFAGITEAQLVSLIVIAIVAPILWINLRKSSASPKQVSAKKVRK